MCNALARRRRDRLQSSGPPPADSAKRRGQRQDTEGLHADGSHHPDRPRQTGFSRQVMDDERLLRLPDPAARSLVGREFQPLRDIDALGSCDRIGSHALPSRFMQSKADKIQFQERRQALGKLTEERRVGEDGFTDFKQCSVMFRLGHFQTPADIELGVVWIRLQPLRNRPSHPTKSALFCGLPMYILIRCR